MKRFRISALLMTVAIFTACSPVKRGETGATLTPETALLLENLRQIPTKGIMFGHHDDTVYGIGWEGDEGRSDVQSVCGDYPAVVSFDLGELELGRGMNLDKVFFDKIRREAVNQFSRGGLVSLSWHPRNPKTGGDAWDTSDSTVVRSVLQGGECHEKFAAWLEGVADFILSLKTPDGTRIPVLFRPWHEHTGSWFWWGEKLCSADDYRQLWTMTVDALRAKGVDNALYAYSSGTEPQDTAQYLERYPGDEVIDVVGFDAYQFDRETFVSSLDRMLAITADVARTHHKVPAVTEAGFEGVPDPKWWTGTLLPVLQKHAPAYVLLWRNAREKPTHFYAPYPGQVSADDFVEFYRNPRTLFAADVDLY